MAKSDQGNLVDAADVAALEKELAKLQAQLKQVYDGFGKLGSLGKAMEAPASSVKTLNAELEETDKLLKLNPSSLTLLRQKQVLLKDSIEETKDKLVQLKAEQKDFAKSDKSINNAQYRELRREIVATKQSLSSLQDEKKSFSIIGSEVKVFKGKIADLRTKIQPLTNGLKSMAASVGTGVKAATTVAVQGTQLAVQQGAKLAVQGSKLMVQGVGASVALAGNALKSYTSKLMDLGKSSLQALDPDGFKAQSDAITAQVNSMKGAIGTGFVPVVSDALNTFSAGVPKITESLTAVFSGQAEGDAGLADGITNMITGMITNVSEKLPALLTQLNTVVGSLLTSFGAILPPLVQTLIPVLLQGLVGLIQTIATQIPALAPGLLEAGVQLFSKLIEGLNTVIPSLVTGLADMIAAIVTAIPFLLPQIIEAGFQLFSSLISGLSLILPSLITGLTDFVTIVIEQVGAFLPGLLEAGVALFGQLVQGLTTIVPLLIEGLTMMLGAIVEQIPILLPILLQAAFDLFNALLSGLNTVVPLLMEQLPLIIQQICGALMQNLPQLINAGIQLIVALATGLPMAIPDLLRAIPQILSAIVNEFKKQDWGTIGKDILGGIIDGLKNALSGIGNKIKEVKDKLLDKFQFYFKINSPSKVFRDEVGKYLAAGIGVGFEQEMKRVTKQMQRAVPVSFAAKASISAQGQYSGASAANALYGQQSVNQTVNIYSPEPLSPAETARQTRNATRQMLLAMKVG